MLSFAVQMCLTYAVISRSRRSSSSSVSPPGSPAPEEEEEEEPTPTASCSEAEAEPEYHAQEYINIKYNYLNLVEKSTLMRLFNSILRNIKQIL